MNFKIFYKDDKQSKLALAMLTFVLARAHAEPLTYEYIAAEYNNPFITDIPSGTVINPDDHIVVLFTNIGIESFQTLSQHVVFPSNLTFIGVEDMLVSPQDISLYPLLHPTTVCEHPSFSIRPHHMTFDLLAQLYNSVSEQTVHGRVIALDGIKHMTDASFSKIDFTQPIEAVVEDIRDNIAFHADFI